MDDANEITITVSDNRTPIVFLFGGQASGKTMMLIRLTRYLNDLGYNVVPDPIFRPDSDRHYQRICAAFNSLVHSDYLSNCHMNFMLVRVIDSSGRSICQIIKTPGDSIFSEDRPEEPFRQYMHYMIHRPNKKIWIFIIEEDYGNQTIRNLYAKKILRMQQIINPKDEVIFVCNKIDKSHHFHRNGRPNNELILKSILSQYPHIFDHYSYRFPILGLFHLFKIIPFSAGAFNRTNDGRDIFSPSMDEYPMKLWKYIKNKI